MSSLLKKYIMDKFPSFYSHYFIAFGISAVYIVKEFGFQNYPNLNLSSIIY